MERKSNPKSNNRLGIQRKLNNVRNPMPDTHDHKDHCCDSIRLEHRERRWTTKEPKTSKSNSRVMEDKWIKFNVQRITETNKWIQPKNICIGLIHFKGWNWKINRIRNQRILAQKVWILNKALKVKKKTKKQYWLPTTKNQTLPY